MGNMHTDVRASARGYCELIFKSVGTFPLGNVRGSNVKTLSLHKANENNDDNDNIIKDNPVSVISAGIKGGSVIRVHK